MTRPLGRRWGRAGRLRANPVGLPLAIDELARFLSTLPRMERRATAAVDAPWGHAEAGDVDLLGFARANHDRAAFGSPGEIRRARRPYPHVEFGPGPHT